MLIFLSLWAFAEASFWFIPPDFLMIPLSIENKKKWLKISTITWLSSVAGGLFYLWWAAHHLSTAQSILEVTPFVNARMHEKISLLYQELGAWGAVFQSWSFTSFKVWTFGAIKHELNLTHYFTIVIASRLFRFIFISWLFSRCSSWIFPYWRKNSVVSWIAYSMIFLLIVRIFET